MSVASINRKIICQPYGGAKKAEAKVTSGFATIKQRNTVIPLKVLADVTDEKGDLLIKQGVFINLAETLVLAKYASLTLEAKNIQEPFIVVDLGDVLYISEE